MVYNSEQRKIKIYIFRSKNKDPILKIRHIFIEIKIPLLISLKLFKVLISSLLKNATNHSK